VILSFCSWLIMAVSPYRKRTLDACASNHNNDQLPN
jgi:hypothetical protein